MSPLISPQPETAEVLQVPRHDRWRILYRLQELDLTCGCTPTGQLWVMTRTPTEALLVHSVLRLFTLNRSGWLSWLERCWSLPPADDRESYREGENRP